MEATDVEGVCAVLLATTCLTGALPDVEASGCVDGGLDADAEACCCGASSEAYLDLRKSNKYPIASARLETLRDHEWVKKVETAEFDYQATSLFPPAYYYSKAEKDLGRSVRFSADCFPHRAALTLLSLCLTTSAAMYRTCFDSIGITLHRLIVSTKLVVQRFIYLAQAQGSESPILILHNQSLSLA